MGIDEIMKKVAQGIPKRTTPKNQSLPFNAPQSTNIPYKGSPQPTSNQPISSPAISAIKDMQNAIQAFVSAVISNRVVRSPDVKTQRKYTITSKDPNAPDSATSKYRDFNDFVTEQYINNSALKGDEWSENQEDNTAPEKLPTELIEMNKVLNTIFNIGSEKSERVIDGIWAWRTQNALLNIYAFADGLIRVSEDFEMPLAPNVRNQYFNIDDLKKLYMAIPTIKDPRDLSPAEQIKRAKQITPLLGKLTNFYVYYSKMIPRNPAYTRMLATNHTQPIYTQKINEPDEADTKDFKDLMGKLDELYLYNIPVTARNGQRLVIPKFRLSLLTSPYHIRALLNQVCGYEPNETNDVKLQRNLLREIKNEVDNRLKTSRSAPAPKSTTTIQPGINPFAPGGPLAPGFSTSKKPA